MTTDTDKLVETALNDAYEKGWCAAAQWANRDDLRHDTGSIAYEGQRDAILSGNAAGLVASLCADVEPMAHRARNSVNEAWTYSSYPLDWRECQPLVPASTVAAITAQRDAALARVAELEAALRTADHTFAENGILASHAARQEIQAALTKGQP